MASSSQTETKPASFRDSTKSEESTAAPTPTIISLNLNTNLLIMANQNEFSHIIKGIGNRLLVVEFYAQWCGPCRSLAAKLEELAHNYNGKILIVKIDVDLFETLTLEYNVAAIPTFMLMKNHKKLEQFSSSNAHILEQHLEKHAGKPHL